MQKTITELRSILQEYERKIAAIPDHEFSAKPLPHKWSKKEVLGHLIDSAQNNLRRFICAQYESTPPKITYEQNFWVSANAYQSAAKEDVISLWKLMNQRIGDVLWTMPSQYHANNCDTGKGSTQLHSIAWLAEDYVKHMKHHLNQIIPGSFAITYP